MIGIIDYGMGNLRSVQKAIEFLGGEAVISSEMRTLDGCERLILPGVGSFAAGMKNLTETGLADYVLRRIKDTPLLGICLGMQFLLSARIFPRRSLKGSCQVRSSILYTVTMRRSRTRTPLQRQSIM